MEFKLGEIFCGPGDIALGAKQAKLIVNRNKFYITHAWANDYDRDTCDTYIHNICPKNPETVICENVRSFDFKKLSPIDGFAFGFPCNDFSLVGEQKGINGNYGGLYTYGINILNHFKPKFFLAENVGGLRNSNDGNAFEKILKDLIKSGYEITPHLYKFENYGVPQSRHRIIIVGIRKDLKVKFKVPFTPNIKKVTSREAIENPKIEINAFNNELTKQSEVVIQRLKYIKPGQNAFNADIPAHLQLNVKGAKISQIYKRLNPDEPSYTVTGSGGGGTHIYHWLENRALTNRERARLQTFPDDFYFCGSKESVRKQIGMAVPPRGAKLIFEAILKTFANVPYPSIEQNIKLSEINFLHNQNL